MLHMINNSLDLYRMELGTYPLQTEPVNLPPLLRTVLSEVSDSIGASDKTSILRLNGKEITETDELYAEAEPMLCYPMLYNLILNAFEASPEVPPEILLDILEDKSIDKAMVEIDLDVEDSCVAIKITNSGAVPDSIRDRFFDKYIPKGKADGTGLGAYTARVCAETQQGTIALKCLPDDRTQITVRLPMVEK